MRVLIFFGSGRFHALVDPLAADGGVDVVDFDADGAGVDGAGLAGVLAFPFEFGGEARAQESQGIEIAFKVPVLAVVGEDAVALRGWRTGGAITAAEPPLEFLAFGVIGSSF